MNASTQNLNPIIKFVMIQIGYRKYILPLYYKTQEIIVNVFYLFYPHASIEILKTIFNMLWSISFIRELLMLEKILDNINLEQVHSS